MKRLACWLVILMFLPRAALAGSAAPALRHVPQTAALVVYIPSIETLIAGLAAFGKAIGVNEMAELSAGEMLEETFDEFAAGVDPAGPLVTMLIPEAEGPVLIAGLRDAEVWKTRTEAEGEYRKFDLYGEPYFALLVDRFVIFGADRAAVSAAAKASDKFAQRFETEFKDIAADQLVCLFIDIPPWKAAIDQGFGLARGAMGMAIGMAGPDAQASVEFFQAMLDALRGLVAEARTYAVGARIGAEGAFLRDRLTVSPEGKAATYFKGIRKSEKPLLRGIPAGRYAIVFAGEWKNPPGAEGPNHAMLRALLETPAAQEQLKDARFKQAIDSTLAFYSKLTGYNGAMGAAPTGKGMLISGVYMSEDAANLQRSFREMFEISTLMSNAFSLNTKLEITARTDRIGDQEVSLLEFAFSGATPEMSAAMNAIYGEGPTMASTVRDDLLYYVVGPRETVRERLAEMLKPDAASFGQDPRAAAANQRIAPDPQVVAYWDTARLVEFGMAMARASGAPVPPLNLPTEPLPLGVLGAYLRPDGVGVEVWVPTASIKPVIDTAKSAKPGADGPSE